MNIPSYTTSKEIAGLAGICQWAHNNGSTQTARAAKAIKTLHDEGDGKKNDQAEESVCWACFTRREVK